MTEDQVISSIDSINQIPETGPNPPPKKKRNLPGNPDPEAEVIALSPKTLMATNRFLCEICGKGFQRDQNLQLHRRGHNLPWKLKQRTTKEPRKRVYVCPEKTCVHHHPSRALGDLTGIKKHFCRKHGEKKWKCDKCSKRYAVQSDWKAHSKSCGTREYKCDCGTIFSRRDSFITHRAFCDALAEETAKITAESHFIGSSSINYHFIGSSSSLDQSGSLIMGQHHGFPYPNFKPPLKNDHRSIDMNPIPIQQGGLSLCTIPEAVQEHAHANIGSFSANPGIVLSNDSNFHVTAASTHDLNWDVPLNNVRDVITVPSLFSAQSLHHHQQTPGAGERMSATALLQKAAQIGATTTTSSNDPSLLGSYIGLKSSSSSSPSCDNSTGIIVRDGTKFFGLYGSSSGMSTVLDLESSVNDDLSGLNQIENAYASSKRQRLSGREDVREGSLGETRDFLGVGVQSICHPSSINGWI